MSRICRQAFTAIAIWRSTCPALLCCTGFFAASSPFSFCYSECFFGIPCSSSATKAFRRHDSTMFGKKNFRNSVQGCLCFLWRLLFHFAFSRLVKLEELFSFPISALFEEGEILEKNICLDKRKGGGGQNGGRIFLLEKKRERLTFQPWRKAAEKFRPFHTVENASKSSFPRAWKTSFGVDWQSQGRPLPSATCRENSKMVTRPRSPFQDWRVDKRSSNMGVLSRCKTKSLH